MANGELGFITISLFFFLFPSIFICVPGLTMFLCEERVSDAGKNASKMLVLFRVLGSGDRRLVSNKQNMTVGTANSETECTTACVSMGGLSTPCVSELVVGILVSEPICDSGIHPSIVSSGLLTRFSSLFRVNSRSSRMRLPSL